MADNPADRRITEVFSGFELQRTPPQQRIRPENAVCWLDGIDMTGHQQRILFDNDLLSRHLMFLGGIGTGKTKAIMTLASQIKKRMTSNDVMIVFDSKGDFVKELFSRGDAIISNDGQAVGPGGQEDYWNIFNEIDRGSHLKDNVFEIANAIFHEKKEKTTQVFFPNAAKDLFAAILLHCCRDNGIKYTNQDLCSFLNSETVQGYLDILACHNDLTAMSSYIDGTGEQSKGVLSEIQTASREMFIGNFEKAGTLSLRQLVRNKGGRAVFIEYDLGIGATLAPIYSLMFDLAIKEALCRTKSEGNVYFICDEFKLVPNLRHIDDAVNFGRSLGVKFMIGIQNVEQIYEAYSGKAGGNGRLAKSILSGFSTNICFRLNDFESRDYIKKLYGDNRKKEVYSSTVHSRGLIENIRDGRVVEDSDILSLPIGRAIIGLPGFEPFRFQINDYKLTRS
ncbi:MAG: type IV secretion system DNA-binding domain-containing protein [Clostridiales bacterium]|nr:type IV secretion system DNA-binding domain-containing protein [Clostridiales bacterium]